MLGYKLVGDVTVSGSATSSISFTGLNIKKGDDYLLVFDCVDNSGDSELRIGFNGNNTVTNYYSQQLDTYSGTFFFAARTNSGRFCYLTNSGNSYYPNGLMQIRLANSGNICAISKWMNRDNIKIRTFYNHLTSTFTVDAITSISINSNGTNIAVGSRFKLYKFTAKKIADIIVGAATTQLDMMGLTFDKTNDYILVADINNACGSTSDFYMRVNGNMTLSNYYRQLLYSSGTGVGGERNNSPCIGTVTSGYSTLIRCGIKLLNSGYPVYQVQENRQYGTSSIILGMSSGSTVFTAQSITQLNIIASAANAIGVGSRFTLYKLC